MEKLFLQYTCGIYNIIWLRVVKIDYHQFLAMVAMCQLSFLFYDGDFIGNDIVIDTGSFS